eukprot:COSAG01_NODE_14566_length_1437_cov_2.226457_1_plen_143_part_10
MMRAAYDITRTTLSPVHGEADRNTPLQALTNGTITTMNVNGIMSDVNKQRRVSSLIRGNAAQEPAEVVGLQEVKQSHNRHIGITDNDMHKLAKHVNPGGRSWWTGYTAFLLHPSTLLRAREGVTHQLLTELRTLHEQHPDPDG